ncbi:MAG: hypothetical protein U0J91_09405, partial [Alistipes ihumii]|nr:hypothetical protein [Alistipes ihumii]
RAGVSFVIFRFLRSLPESIGLTDEQPGSTRADKRRTDMARSGSLVMGSGLTGDKNRDFSRQNRTTGSSRPLVGREDFRRGRARKIFVK